MLWPCACGSKSSQAAAGDGYLLGGCASTVHAAPGRGLLQMTLTEGGAWDDVAHRDVRIRVCGFGLLKGYT